MVGNIDDAALAARDIAGYRLGIGAYRKTYLINGVVYKVTYDGDGRGDNANLSEWSNYTDTGVPFVRFPETTLWPVGGMPVIAMTYVDGLLMGECYCTPDEECQDSCLSDDERDMIEKVTGVCDLGYGNVIVTPGVYWVVDFDW